MSEYPIAGLMPWDILNATKSWKRNTVTITIWRELAQDLAANVTDAKESTIVEVASLCRAELRKERAQRVDEFKKGETTDADA